MLQSSIESPGKGQQMAFDPAAVSTAELDEPRLLALFGILTSPSQSSASAGAAAGGDSVDSLRERPFAIPLDGFLHELGSLDRAQEKGNPQV